MKLRMILLFLWIGQGLWAQRLGDEFSQSMSMAHEINSPTQSANTVIDPNNYSSIDKSGDLSASLPLITIQGRQLRLPIQLSYQSGIKIHQKASSVGLGWNISFGSITRDYGAFEPDYYETSVETDMINVTTDIAGDLTVSNSATQFINTLHRNKPLAYQGLDGTDEERMTPDLYYLNIPGMEGNTFWNAGDAGASHSMVWEKFKNWKISHSPKTYTVAQEVSRINEINNPTASTATNQSQQNSFAAAIAIPPYVSNRSFTKLVEANTPPTNDFDNIDELTVQYQDFGNFIITDESGVQYVFGRALRGQKYLLQNDPYWSTIKGDLANYSSIAATNGKVLGEFWKIDYIAEWLLTEVRAVDYVDQNANGYADDGDLGDWIRIEYTAPTQQESLVTTTNSFIQDVPTHREWMNFSRTDKASSLMRERAYVTKITTPIEEYDFEISERFDVDHDYFSTPMNNGGIGNITADQFFYAHKTLPYPTAIEYPVETMKYDKITRKERIHDDIISTTILEYAAKGSSDELAVSDYLILKNDKTENNISEYEVHSNFGYVFDVEDYNAGDSRGKTTLIGVSIYPADNLLSNQAQKYHFEYDKNPSFNPIHKHNILYQEDYPSIRCSYSRPNYKDKNFIPTLYPFEVNNNLLGIAHSNSLLSDTRNTAYATPLGYYNNPASPSTFNSDAWSLTKITFPQGGSVSFEYEKDETDFQTLREGVDFTNLILPNRIPFILNYNRAAAVKGAVQSQINDQSNNLIKTLPPVFKTPEEFYGLRLKRKVIDDNNGNLSTIDYDYGTGHHTYVPRSYWQSTLEAFSAFMQYQFINQEGIHLYDPTLNSENQGYFQDGDLVQLFWIGSELRENDFTTFLQTLQSNVRIDHTVKDDSHFYTHIDEVYADGSKKRRTYGQVAPVRSPVDHVIQEDVYLRGFFMDEGNVVEMITNKLNPAQEVVLKKEEWFQSGAAQAVFSKTWTHEIDIKVQKDNQFKEKVFHTNRQLVFNYKNGLIAKNNVATHESFEVTDPLHYLRFTKHSIYDINLLNLASDALTFYLDQYNSNEHPAFIGFSDYLVYNAEDHTRYLSHHTRIIKEETLDHRDNPAGSQVITSTTDYHFDHSDLALPTRLETLSSEEPGKTRLTHTLYPHDYTNTGGFIGNMKSLNIIRPIEVVESLFDLANNSHEITGALYNRYYDVGIHKGLLKSTHRLELDSPLSMSAFGFSNRSGTGFSQIPPLGTNSTFNPSSLYGPAEMENFYIPQNRLIESIENKSGPDESYHYGYHSAFPVAKIIGAKSEEVITENFEELASGFATEGYTGKQSYLLFGDYPAIYQLEVESDVRQNEAYDLSFRFKSNGLQTNQAFVQVQLIQNPGLPSSSVVASGMSPLVLNDTEGAWELIELPIELPSLKEGVDISPQQEVGLRIQVINQDQTNFGLIDDVRLHPSSVQLSTYTYLPLKGISSITDARLETQFFEYDDFGRLVQIKDADGMILQTSQYNIAQP